MIECYRHRKFSSILILVALVIFKWNSLQAQTGYELARTMFAETKKINSMKFTMKKIERIEDEMIVQVNDVKLSLNPYQIYSVQQSPNDGLEILYCEGEFENKAWINPNGFPWLSLRLDPLGSIMRNDQHHTLLNSGYTFVISILEHLFNKYGEETRTMVKKLQPVNYNGQECLGIEFNNPYYKYVNHTVKKGETLLSIADSLKISEYAVMTRNKGIDDYDDVKVGQVINIPSDYSPKMVIYLDSHKLIPMMMKIYDDKGVFEMYEYSDVELNHEFKSDDFSIDNESYDF